MIEQGQHNFVAGSKLPSDGAAHGKGERGHVETEDHLVRVAAEEIGHGFAGFGDGLVGAPAGEIGAAGVRVGVLQVTGNGVDHALRNLRSPGTVEVGGGEAIHLFGEGRELGTDGVKVESRECVLSYGHGFLFAEVVS